MVRGIYQSGETTDTQNSLVSSAIAVMAILLCLGGLFTFINHWGGRIVSMRYYDQEVSTYKEHAEKALSRAGYGYTKLKDLGDAERHTYDPNPKIRKFLARDLRVPGSGTIHKAHVYVKFDSWNQNYAVTTVQGYEGLR